MQKVTSRDGIPIAYWRSGSGPPLVLVHGTTAAHDTTWRIVGPLLAEHRTVYAMDRRGRGGSGDGPEYSVQREAEDVAAVIDAIGGPVDVLGHSYGGLCTLEAALLTPNVRRMILYEGIIVNTPDYGESGIADRIEALLQAGDTEGALVTMLREVALMTPEEIGIMRSQADAWEARRVNMPTVPRELRAGGSHAFEPQRFAGLRMPALVMVGGDSPPEVREGATELAEALPNARVLVLPGQQHGAMYTAPDLFVTEVLRFLAGAEAP